MKTKVKDLLLEAYNSSDVCQEWKDKIKDVAPKLFVKEELEVGKWYNYNNCLINYQGLNTMGFFIGYGFIHGVWEDLDDKGIGRCAQEWIIATNEEIEQALKKEAKKRGFKKGAYMVHNKEKYPDQQEPILIENNKFELIVGGFCVFGWEIFSNGKWATIIEDKKEMTVSDIEKELGYSVKIVK